MGDTATHQYGVWTGPCELASAMGHVSGPEDRRSRGSGRAVLGEPYPHPQPTG